MLSGRPKNADVPRGLSHAHKHALLTVFCLAQFIDAFSITALFSAIPSLVISLEMTAAESSWIISAFTLTFASFLLMSGRISDVYGPKSAFITGLCSLGLLSLGEGFVEQKIVLIVLRASSGIAASLTIPSALKLLTRTFAEPSEQGRALGIFGGCGAVGDILGLVIGATFVQLSSIDRGWRWVFWNIAMLTLPLAVIGAILIPPERGAAGVVPTHSNLKRFDVVGVSILTVSLILLIFAITSGSATGWRSSRVLAPFVIALLLQGCFFFWETLIPAELAAVPPRTWLYTNFTVLFALALLPFFWWTVIFMTFNTLWQDIYRWTALKAAAHLIPLGIVALLTGFSGSLSAMFKPKRLLLFAQGLLLVGSALLRYADKPEKYWTVAFPAFLVGSTGSMLTYMHASVAIFQIGPSSMRGTVGAMFNGALQLGSAIGIATFNAIQVSVDAKAGGLEVYKGRAAAFWFVVGVICVEAIAILVFYHEEKESQVPDDERLPDGRRVIVVTLKDTGSAYCGYDKGTIN